MLGAKCDVEVSLYTEMSECAGFTVCSCEILSNNKDYK